MRQTKTAIAIPNATIAVDISKTEQEIAYIIAQSAQLVKICVTAYPNSDKFQTEEAVANTVSLWANFFADDDWRIVAMAVKKHIATNKWAPSVAEIREIVTEITRPDIVPPDKAWELVSRYLQLASEYGADDPERIFPPMIAETIRAIGLSALKKLHFEPYRNHGKVGIDKLTFMQIYEPRYERQRKEAALSPTLNGNIRAIQAQITTNRPDEVAYDWSQNYIEGKERERKELYEQLERRNLEQLMAYGGSNE